MHTVNHNIACVVNEIKMHSQLTNTSRNCSDSSSSLISSPLILSCEKANNRNKSDGAIQREIRNRKKKDDKERLLTNANALKSFTRLTVALSAADFCGCKRSGDTLKRLPSGQQSERASLRQKKLQK